MTNNNRIVLIVSEKMARRYHPALSQLLEGLRSWGGAVFWAGPIDIPTERGLQGTLSAEPYPSTELPGMEWYNRRRLLDQVQAFNPTVLHVWDEQDANLASFLAQHLDVPYILHVNSIQETPDLSVSSLRCSSVLVPSQTILESMQTHHPRLGDRTYLQPMTCDIAEQSFCFNQPQCKPCLIIDHPLQKAQDFHPLMNALQTLKKVGTDVVAFLVGPSYQETGIRHLIHERNLQESITIHSDQHLSRSQLWAGDIYIQLHPVPFFNSHCLEAMGGGLAVIASSGACDDLQRTCSSVQTFTADDTHRLQSTLQKMLNNPPMTRTLGEQNRQYIHQHHSQNDMFQGILEAYERCHAWSFGLQSIA